MLDLALLRRALVAGAVLVAVAVVAAACAGDRPTLTTDRIAEAADSTPLLDPEPTLDPTTDAGAALIDEAPVPTPPTSSVEQLVVQVLESFPHDPDAFTQGLELHDGYFIESTGLRSESDLRRVEPTTGAVVQIQPTPSNFFAEGITKVGDQLVQLTWQDGTAFYWDATTFELIKEVPYSGEGWGLCYDGRQLVMTDGTPTLIFRDPASFDELGRVEVSIDGNPVEDLNEIECVDGEVWANVWQTDTIVRIDPTTGAVTGVVDASGLERPPLGEADVLNGIAWDPTSRTFWITGKLWPTMYRVEFVPAQDG